MAGREKVIKAYEDFVNGYECFCTSDDCEYEMHKAVLALLKEQERLIRKKQKDIDKLCAEYSNLKHRFHEKTEIVRCKACHYGIRNSAEDIFCIKAVYNDKYKRPNWFCADGERRSE